MNVTRGFSPALYVGFTSPPDYARGCCYDGNSGEWVGPRYEATERPSLGGTSSIGWGVGFDDRPTSAEAAARASLTHNGTVVESGAISVPHLMKGREVGKIPGFRVITQLSELAGNARHEAGVGFPLGRRVYAAAEFSALSPCCDKAAPFGVYLVKGKLASQWNREQTQIAVRGVRLEGNLPPARLTAARNGRRVSGSVSDSFGHPNAGLSVVVRNTRGRSCCRGATNASGRFAIRLPRGLKAGRYTVSATLAGVTVRRTFAVR